MSEDSKQEMTGPVLEKIQALVYQHTGITMSEKKKNLLQNRLRSRISQLKLGGYEDYINYLNSNAGEVKEFVNLVTTNETTFFRTPRIWSYFSEQFLPAWKAQNLGRPLKVWSAASSTGEEGVTISILCREFQKKNPGFDYRIIGTDISSDVVETAKKAVYTGKSITDLKARNAKYMDEYFTKISETTYQVKSEVTSKLDFRVFNLYHSPKALGTFDIAFLRNVLIYFKNEDQVKIINNVGTVLDANGVLIVGESESLSRLETDFSFDLPLVYRLKKKMARAA